MILRFGSSPIDWVHDIGVISQGQVDPATLQGRHRLQLEHLAGLDDALCGSLGDLTQLALPATPVVLDIHEDPGPLRPSRGTASD